MSDDARARLYRHGGDLASAALAFPEAPRPWIDLSTGINPVPYPVADLPASAFARLPSPAEAAGLEAIAARRYGAQAASVVAAPGTQALIQWVPRLWPRARVKVLGFTYAEHERGWRTAGAEVETVGALDEIDGDEAVVAVNPNNPDGRPIAPAVLRRLGEKLQRGGGLLVVDEAFMDFRADSVIPDLPPATLVLRSFGKTYGLAGVRLGFAVAEESLAARLRGALGPWSVAGPALTLAARALADDAWLEAARARLAEDAAWLDGALQGAGFEFVGGTELFRLARHRDAAARFLRLCEAGVLARPFSQRPDWLRFGVPTRDQRDRLARALGA